MSVLQELLEDFSAPEAKAQPSGKLMSDADLEGFKLEAFESGYRAGWDDALKAQSQDRESVSSAFAQQIQDLSFTYHEAYAHVMNSVAPLLEEMSNVLLPQMAQATLGQHIYEQLHRMAQEIGQMRVQVAVSPENADAILPILDTDFGFPVDILQDETLAQEQADIRFGETERQIDLSDLVQTIKDSVAGLAHDNRRKMNHG